MSCARRRDLRGVVGVVRDVLRDGVCDDCGDEIVEAMMRRGVFPLPCHSMAAGGWQGVGFEERVTNFAWCAGDEVTDFTWRLRGEVADTAWW